MNTYNGNMLMLGTDCASKFEEAQLAERCGEMEYERDDFLVSDNESSEDDPSSSENVVDDSETESVEKPSESDSEYECDSDDEDESEDEMSDSEE